MTSQNSLIIFTRYPEKGKTKTRLIPAIGAEKAADFQRQMTELTMKTVGDLTTKLVVNIEVYFNGGNLSLMQNWLGEQYHYQLQAEGDLGTKMYSAMTDCFSQGSQKVVIIGIDCPSLSVDILSEAFNSLNDRSMVIGGADDGGYYLLGLTQLDKSLFEDIDWGTDKVFSKTMAVANKLNYQVHQLPILKDIDRPEDLEFWYQQQKL